MDEIQADVSDVIGLARDFIGDLDNAESCETKEDFLNNLRSAKSIAKTLEIELSKLIKRAEKLSKGKVANVSDE